MNPDTKRRLLVEAETIAIVGASSNPERASHGIMKKLLSAGYRVIPVNPNETEVLGQPAYASLTEVPVPIDIVDVFRRAEETPLIADEAVRVGAKALWLQSGIVSEEAAKRARGLTVIMDTCIGVEHSLLRVPKKRRITQVITTAPPEPGFIGAGHTAVEVLDPSALEQNDPFVLLMDDRLSLGAGRRIGEAHPHAGLETVTLILQGELNDKDEGALSAGDAIWMTAGRGIIHNEDVFVKGDVRVLQLWIRLAKAERDAEPRFEIISRKTLPVRREENVEARVYSGKSGALVSPTKNHVPVTLVDMSVKKGRFAQDLPANYAGFVYVIEGALDVGGATLGAGQVGFIDSGDGDAETTLHVRGDGRAVLYAGVPQREPIVQHGPFVADSKQGIVAMFDRFRSGGFVRMSELAHKGGPRGSIDASAPRS